MAFQIPPTTLQIAQTQTTIQAARFSEVIRVGIGNQAFSSYVYKTIGIYGTGTLELYGGNKLVQSFPANTNINISINPDLT